MYSLYKYTQGLSAFVPMASADHAAPGSAGAPVSAEPRLPLRIVQPFSYDNTIWQATVLYSFLPITHLLYLQYNHSVMKINEAQQQRIANMSFASVYPHYIAKVEKKGRSKAELDEVISWLTGYTADELQMHINNKTTLDNFFGQARLHPNAHLITGVICGYRVEDIEHPLIQQVRYLDKLVDELAKGKKMEKILRQ